jgi:hypothetical protein
MGQAKFVGKFLTGAPVQFPRPAERRDWGGLGQSIGPEVRDMGEIVPFRIARRPRVAASPEGPARILFFLGVRYVRHDDGADGPKGRTSEGGGLRKTRRRKRA